MQKPVLIACWILFGACLGLSAQVVAPAEVDEAPVPTTEYVYDRDIRFLALDEDDMVPILQEEYHLEAWVAEIKGHYVALQEYANVPDLRDPSGRVMEWRPPMAAFNR